MKIPFNKPHLTEKELEYIAQAHSIGSLSGDGLFTKKCHQWLEKEIGTSKALLTHSCTAALEMMAILLDLKPGDEIIMPSYTFVSTANAFALRGAIPVFVDIRHDSLNIDESIIEAAISSKTKAIIVVHYAGVACEMDFFINICKKHNLFLLEDAAQGLMSKYKGKNLGTIGDLAAISFHETKNIISGEGGALLINNPKFKDKAEIIREKGTNRSLFFRGQVDKYTWVEIGSSYLPGEIIAAFLFAQLEKAKEITDRRIELWNRYKSGLLELESRKLIRLPFIPLDCIHNAHMFYIIVDSLEIRQRLIEHLKSLDILAVFHYVPLHSSPAGLKYGKTSGTFEITNMVSDTLLRLPLYYDMKYEDQNLVIATIENFFNLPKN